MKTQSEEEERERERHIVFAEEDFILLNVTPRAGKFSFLKYEPAERFNIYIKKADKSARTRTKTTNTISTSKKCVCVSVCVCVFKERKEDLFVLLFFSSKM